MALTEMQTLHSTAVVHIAASSNYFGSDPIGRGPFSFTEGTSCIPYSVVHSAAIEH
jgi:hypothetical protein